MAGSGMLKSCRFCPKCGVESLERDVYRTGPKSNGYPEFMCTTCCFSFRIHPSKRVEAAEVLFAEHRKMREPST
jgi:transposase-like protein